MGKSRSHVLKLSTKVLTVFNILAQTQWNSPISKIIIDLQGSPFKFTHYLKQVSSAYSEATGTCNTGIEREFCWL